MSFLWTGSAFISVAYRLMNFYTPLQIDIYHVIIGYMLQVCGILLFSTGLRFRPTLFSKRYFFIALMFAEALVISIAFFSSSAALSLIFAFAMNILHGMIAGVYLTQLSRYVPQQYRGRAFGLGYAAGSIGSWLLSLPYGGSFLKMDAVIPVYLFLIASTVFLTSRVPTKYSEPSGNLPKKEFNMKWLIKIFIVLALLSMVKNIGFYFPAADISGIINVEFSRAFYAVGLIVAGIINDINRRYGAICCVASLAFAFFSFAFTDSPGYKLAIWIIGYIFFGFFSVYRVVVFSDIASKKSSLIPLAAFGLMAGRTGDSLGTLGGVLLTNHTVGLILVTSGFFVLVIVMFFSVYHKLYGSVLTESARKEQQYEEFENYYTLTARESEVFRLVVEGFSNLEISGSLFVSESTVKFHVGHILKKTGCSNRTDLTMRFKGRMRTTREST